jgi:hypothetical protein
MKMPITCCSIAPSVSDVVIPLELDGIIIHQPVSMFRKQGPIPAILSCWKPSQLQHGGCGSKEMAYSFHQTRPSIEL